MSFTDVIVLAGGFGERLWPASSAEFPKQFMSLGNGLSFLQNSVKRALALNVPGKIVIVTRRDIQRLCAEQCESLASKCPSETREKISRDVVILAEPRARHTAAAIMSGVSLVKKFAREGGPQDRLVLTLTSDHAISPTEVFNEDCAQAAKAAGDGKFVCFAVPPSSPDTGYGYIKIGRDVYGDEKIYSIENFKEKPSLEIAKVYIADGGYWWNSGMFAFNADCFLREMEKCSPKIFSAFKPMIEGAPPALRACGAVSAVDSWEALEKVYESAPAEAVDKAVAEKTKNAVAVKANFNWTDVGSWDSFCALCQGGESPDSAQINCGGNFVYSDIPVAICGASDLIVVVKNGKLLIVKKGESGLAREAARRFAEKPAGSN